MLIRAGISLLTAALGLLVASWILDRFQVAVVGFITAAVVFAIAQAIFTPFVFSVARKHAPALLGGIGLVSTFVALVIASVLTDGLRITGVSTWILASLIVWVVTALGTWLLPMLFLRTLARRLPAAGVTEAGASSSPVASSGSGWP